MSAQLFGLFACLLAAIYHGDADPVSFINKCKPGDLKCLKQSTQSALPTYMSNGIPELKISPLDPLHIKKIDASGNGLNLVVTDVVITGLKGCQVKKMKWDQNPTHLQAQVLCDINLDGQYDMSGSLLVIPIEGNGAVRVNLRKIYITLDANIEDKTRDDGKVSWNIKSWSHSFELKDKANVKFENLFKNNQALGDAARAFVASSSNEIITEVGPPVVKSVASKLIKNINHFFNAVPYEDLVDVA